ncbi:MAG: DNA-binding protein [Actinomycetota bacterium]|nr:DNA-binding protein [Actinomycetota bacterium]
MTADDTSTLPPGLSAPARRALAEAGLDDLDAVARHGRGPLGGLHGMGPKAIATLESAMSDAGLRFADDG